MVFFSCKYVGGKRVTGNGSLATEERAVSNFSDIEVQGGVDVYVTQGANYAVKVEADRNLLPYIETESDGDELEIGSRDGYNLRPRAGMKVYVTVPALAEIGVSGSGTALLQNKLTSNGRVTTKVSGSGDIKGAIDAPQVSANIAGSGTITLSGNTRDFKAGIGGSGDIRCFDLMSEATDINISGSGNAQVYASKQLDVNIAGSGDVQYRGTATVNQRIAGAGSIRKVE